MTDAGRARAILLAGMLAASSSARAQSLPDLSLEELMKMDAGKVFGASERLQPVIEAPASVSFITADEIARHGYRTLADILRGVRGMYVVDDRNYSLVGTRGFALPGDYDSRMLLLVNGHRVNDNVYESTFLGISFVNHAEVRAKGLELEAQMRLRGESRALVSYALQSAVEQELHTALPNSPRHMAKARISVPGPLDRSFISLEGQYLSSRLTLAAAEVSAAATVAITMIQPLGRSWDLSGGVRNIFDTRYSDPVSAQHKQDTVPQNGRTARIGLRWKLWTNEARAS